MLLLFEKNGCSIIKNVKYALQLEQFICPCSAHTHILVFSQLQQALWTMNYGIVLDPLCQLLQVSEKLLLATAGCRKPQDASWPRVFYFPSFSSGVEHGLSWLQLLPKDLIVSSPSSTEKLLINNFGEKMASVMHIWWRNINWWCQESGSQETASPMQPVLFKMDQNTYGRASFIYIADNLQGAGLLGSRVTCTGSAPSSRRWPKPNGTRTGSTDASTGGRIPRTGIAWWRGHVSSILHKRIQLDRSSGGTTRYSSNGAQLPDHVHEEVTTTSYKCHCHRGFKNKTALAVHQRQAHQKHAPEFHLASGTVCPSCLVNYWSTKRLRQHLSYAPRDGSPNVCFSQLQQSGVHFGQPEVQHPSKAFLGINRLDAVRVPGPEGHSLTGQFALRRQLHDELVLVEAQLSALGWNRHPDRDVWHTICEALTAASESWYEQWWSAYPRGDESSIQDAWLEVFAKWPEREAEMSIIFLHWADECTEDLFALWGNSFAAEAVERQCVDLSRAFETTPLLRKRRSLMLRMDRLAVAPPPPLPHRPVYRGPANQQERQLRDAGVPGFYHRQAEWKAELEKLHFAVLPHCCQLTPQICELGERPCFLIVHLFSGRRRPHDFHDHLLRLCHGLPFEVRVLSMDTAVSEEFGDLRHDEAPWKLLHKWYSTGRVAATLAGSPCETFSEARHYPLIGPDGVERAGPRVLRTAACLWGIAGRTKRELRQLTQGSNFALQVMWSAAMAALYGGLYVSEHPAPPRDESRASVWTSPLMRLLRELPAIQFHVLSQWLWGAATPKPTGFLAVRLPSFRTSMERWQLPQATRPEACKMGLGPDGEFATSPMKEYPGALCGGLAQAIRDQLLRQHRQGSTTCCRLPPSELQWLGDAAERSAVIDSARSMRPDWQDRWNVKRAEQRSAPKCTAWHFSIRRVLSCLQDVNWCSKVWRSLCEQWKKMVGWYSVVWLVVWLICIVFFCFVLFTGTELLWFVCRIAFFLGQTFRALAAEWHRQGCATLEMDGVSCMTRYFFSAFYLVVEEDF